ncbi:cell division protein FtsQ/DivIB [Acidipropionibacterium virtanenii]|uniref:Cell division protein FtsQ n=1 Tax=Acidipropionibacterium virtanenii TaxID=2057246 RepID=A0A344UV93_9ACTN|nr:FtsQ-type POTRA domain-containing protein [Acidipropionibacterium virtanenii]AXE39191.1 Cell division protein FtsQ [Acidipropionibacterium virtanenii]
MASSVSDITGPLDLRARSRRRRIRIVTVVAVLVAVLLAVGVYVVRWSGLMAADQVVVDGARLVTADQVRDAARVPIGAPLATIDLGAVGSRVAALEPVHRVSVHRAWPDTVRIRITERRPVYQLRDQQGYHWIDASGTAFHTTTASRRGTPWALTATRSTRLLRDVATVAASLDPALLKQLDHLEAGGPDSITLVLSKGRTVMWGSADESDVKSQVATAMVATKATHYDVSSPQNPTAR